MTKPLFALPYHDPKGIYNDKFKASLPKLQEIFSHLVISASPDTAENAVFFEFLKKAGVDTYINEPGSNIGDHFRKALKMGIEKTGDAPIFYGFIDRTLFALNSNYSKQFIKDIETDWEEMVLFERSELAWSTHPVNYREMEQSANKMGKHLLGQEVELASCGFLLKQDWARKILAQSQEKSFSVETEWILLAYLLGIKPIIKKVDWLGWEDPYILDINEKKLKIEREHDPLETQKRLVMNVEIANVLIQTRFLALLKR